MTDESCIYESLALKLNIEQHTHKSIFIQCLSLPRKIDVSQALGLIPWTWRPKR
jgi:hypothetical protein